MNKWPVEIRDLAATAHNVISSYRTAQTSGGDHWCRLTVKVEDMERSLGRFRDFLELEKLVDYKPQHPNGFTLDGQFFETKPSEVIHVADVRCKLYPERSGYSIHFVYGPETSPGLRDLDKVPNGAELCAVPPSGFTR